MAARVCEPIRPSSEPEEMPRQSSASCASKTVWTGRGNPGLAETSGPFVFARAGKLETITVRAGSGATLPGLVFVAAHQSQTNPNAARTTNSQRTPLAERRDRAN